MPPFNDCDGGRLICMVPQALDAGPSLMCAESIFSDEYFLPEPTPKRGYATLFSTKRRDESSRDVLRRRTAGQSRTRASVESMTQA